MAFDDHFESEKYNSDCKDFPTISLLPKKETQVLSFLSKYPEYDGRGITIAIFDSGVDPGAPGLQITSENKPKVIERFDCSGAGDIDMTNVVKPVNGKIQGLSGRTLKIPKSWSNPSGEYRIGIRNGYEMLNKTVKDRVHKMRKEELWDISYKTIFAESSIKSQEYSKNCENKSNLTREEKLAKEDLENQVEILNNLDKKYADPGPVYDFIMFFDGKHWRAAMDTTEKGDLKSCKLLKEFSTDPTSYATFPENIPFTYSFNVHDDGNVLEMVICASTHGTHVAAIAAAYFPNDPKRNGIAPGAQIISLTLADHRIDTMETGTALARAMIRVRRRIGEGKEVNVINMSYGEMAHFGNSGHLSELMNEIIDKNGVVWVASAGNHGPGLFTISTPPFISTNNVIGVGAYISSDMMSAEYSMREKLPETCYTWSSRGPTLDGDHGITVCAPGGAITSVPNYTLKYCELLNGTSMASPHVSGAVALLLSALSQKGIQFTPYQVKRALENTARFDDTYDYFAQGYGLLQINKAFEHILNYPNELENKIRFHVTCPSTLNKGIIVTSNRVTDSRVSVEPVFHNTDKIDTNKKIEFKMSLILSCDASYVSLPEYVAIANSTREFLVRVDPTHLRPGVHATSITAYDSQNVRKGPVFRVEVTVIKYEELPKEGKPEFQYREMLFKPNTIKRHFFKVPEGVTRAIVDIENLPDSKERSGRFMLHCSQIVPKKSCSSYEYQKIFYVFDKNETALIFPVKPGYILQFALAKFWSSLGEMKVNYSIQFQGCGVSQHEYLMHHSEGLYRFDIQAGIQTEEIHINAVLKNNIVVLKPVDATIVPLNRKRDIFPPCSVTFQLQLTYNFHINKTTDCTLFSPLLCEYLYENDYESQMWLLFDNNKKYVAAGDAYPERYAVKLEKGDYIVRQQVRHSRKDLLDKLIDMPMLLSQKLSSNITLDAYTSTNNATFGKKMKSVNLIGRSDTIIPIYLAPAINDKLPKMVTPGQYLTGTITLTRDKLGKKTETFPLKYYITDVSKKTIKPCDYPKTKTEEFEDAYNEFMTSWITKYEPDDQYAVTLYNKMKTKAPNNYLVHTAMLQNLEPEGQRYLPGFAKGAPTKSYLLRVISLADEVINKVNETEILAFIGNKLEPQNELEAKLKSAMNSNKTALVEALGRKGCAMSQYYLISRNKTNKKEEKQTDEPNDDDDDDECEKGFEKKEGEEEKRVKKKKNEDQEKLKIDENVENNEVDENEVKITLEEIDAVWLKLLQFVDAQDVKGTYFFALWHAAAFRHYGRLVKALLKLSEEKATPELDTCLLWTFSQLKWEHCVRLFKNRLLVNYPSSFQLF